MQIILIHTVRMYIYILVHCTINVTYFKKKTSKQNRIFAKEKKIFFVN